MDSAQQTKKQKEAAALVAAELVQDGMLVGLGSGSTAEITLAAIGERVKHGLKITGIATSEKTKRLAETLNIPLATLDDFPKLDLALDGADEIEIGPLHLIKGGGGNLLREKLVAIVSDRFVIVADERKLSARLGSRSSVPVDVAPFGWKSTANRLERMGAQPTLRLDTHGKPFLTDGGAYVLDCGFGVIHSPLELQERLDSVVGVVEHGLFLGMATEVIIGGIDGVRRVRPDGQATTF
ncbi:MAG: ribose-5-phosphate isomerase RpiA [Acidobacteria bacterium]|nr:ribose-5-phosphate isomerase RpiA [Acidobacteriota bacterium]